MEPKKDFYNDKIVLPANQIPSYRIAEATQRGASNCWLFYCWGGLGDQVCSEPTIRWAYKNLPWKRFGIVTDSQDIFSHIDCEKYSTSELKKLQESGKWYVCPTIFDPKNLSWEFFSHMLVQAVDYVSINCLRSQLPVADREIFIEKKEISDPLLADVFAKNQTVVIHPGKHWPSKTFPPEFWAMVVETSLENKLQPILIGKQVDDNVGYVDFEFDDERVIDLRNQITLHDMIAILQSTDILISNDSSPIHISASGKAKIGCIATVKHPDYIKHWRNGVWGKDFWNLSKGGLWQKYSISPFTEKTIACEDIDPDYLQSILPTKDDIQGFLDEIIR